MAQQAAERVTLAVSGMHCGGCAAGVQRALIQTAGVQAAEVSVAAGQATVEYDPAQTDPQALAAVVTAAGYRVAPLA